MSTGLLVNYAGVPQEISSLFPDNGLAVLASALVRAGHDVKVLDYSTTQTIRAVYDGSARARLGELAPRVFSDSLLGQSEIAALLEVEKALKENERLYLDRIAGDIVREIARTGASWVGFKLWLSGMDQSMHLASKLKEAFPAIKVFGGGPSVDSFRAAILKRHPVMDALVFAEGEEALLRLARWADGYGDLASIPGLFFRQGDAVVSTPVQRMESLDDLPFACYDRDVYPAMGGDGKMKVLCFDESRGCPMGCAFCLDAGRYGRRRIEKTARRCADEIAHLHEAHGVDHFRFSGSNTSARLLSGIADEIIERGLDVRFSVFSTPAGMTEDLVAKLARAGLFGVFMGLESVDPEQLKRGLGKGISVDKVRDSIRMLKAHGIFISVSMIYPAPCAPPDILERTVEFLADCLEGYPSCSVPVFPSGLYPYTGWFERPEDFGFELSCGCREAYVEEAMGYSYKITLPRYLWEELPYRLDGRSFRQMLGETHRLATELRRRGLLTYFPEGNLMVAPRLGYESYHDFARDSTLAFFTGDADRLEAWNKAFNEASREAFQKASC